MAGYSFSRTPSAVPHVETTYRRIVTPQPAPAAIAALDSLDHTEARAMHGQLPVLWDRAEGFQVFDRDGNCWIDFTSTIFVTNVGHAHPRVTSALRDVIDGGLLHSYTFATDLRVRYLERLAGFTPAPLDKAFLLSAGTEATECAIKLMRMHGNAVGKRRGGIVAFEGAMHGRTLGAEMLSKDSDWIGYHDPNMHRFPFPFPWRVDVGGGRDQFTRDIEALRTQGIDPDTDLCGFILESYIGWGAILIPDDYVQALAEFAREHDILLVFDEIQGGFGRTGKLFVYEHYGVVPDLVCCGKGIASGLPLSAVIGRAGIMDLPEVGAMSSTHSANPLVCAAGLATIDVIEDENLIEESWRKGELLHRRLGELKGRHPRRISHVLGRGLLAALLVVDDAGAPDGQTASRIAECAMQKGLLVVHTGRESIKLGPPLSIPDSALEEGVTALAEAFEEILG